MERSQDSGAEYWRSLYHLRLPPAEKGVLSSSPSRTEVTRLDEGVIVDAVIVAKHQRKTSGLTGSHNLLWWHPDGFGSYSIHVQVR